MTASGPAAGSPARVWSVGAVFTVGFKGLSRSSWGW